MCRFLFSLPDPGLVRVCWAWYESGGRPRFVKCLPPGRVAGGGSGVAGVYLGRMALPVWLLVKCGAQLFLDIFLRTRQVIRCLWLLPPFIHT